MENVETAVAGLPRLNERAPEFKAPTTDGVKSLDDYKGKWLVLFSHPADFTPVCTTEFMAFAKMAPEFNKRNCELLGLSIDSHHSHIAWMRNIKEKFGVATPEGWQPGDRVIVPPSATAEGANERMESDEYECVDFYFCTKQL